MKACPAVHLLKGPKNQEKALGCCPFIARRAFCCCSYIHCWQPGLSEAQHLGPLASLVESFKDARKGLGLPIFVGWQRPLLLCNDWLQTVTHAAADGQARRGHARSCAGVVISCAYTLGRPSLQKAVALACVPRTCRLDEISWPMTEPSLSYLTCIGRPCASASARPSVLDVTSTCAQPSSL